MLEGDAGKKVMQREARGEAGEREEERVSDLLAARRPLAEFESQDFEDV